MCGGPWERGCTPKDPRTEQPCPPLRGAACLSGLALEAGAQGAAQGRLPGARAGGVRGARGRAAALLRFTAPPPAPHAEASVAQAPGPRAAGETREPRGRNPAAVAGASDRSSARGRASPRDPAGAPRRAHALPRREPRRSRGPAAAAGRLIPGRAGGPRSTPGGRPRRPRTPLAPPGSCPVTRRLRNQFGVGDASSGGRGEARGECRRGWGAGLPGSGGPGSAFVFCKCSAKAAFPRLGTEGAGRQILSPARCRRGCGRAGDRVTPRNRAVLGVWGSDPFPLGICVWVSARRRCGAV